ncbi:MAG: L-gulono,4-lactone dehydrogenase, partial [Microbacteriaceae bacterium]|nr:L-gulono,4-lactone dehydrogenase [Microbacteriaceae bacterium]
MHWENWSGLESAEPRTVIRPRSTDEVVEAVAAAARGGTTVKMVGTGHSFPGIAAPGDAMLLPHLLSGIVGVDREAMTVTALAGTPLKVLNA